MLLNSVRLQVSIYSSHHDHSRDFMWSRWGQVNDNFHMFQANFHFTHRTDEVELVLHLASCMCTLHSRRRQSRRKQRTFQIKYKSQHIQHFQHSLRVSSSEWEEKNHEKKDKCTKLLNLWDVVKCERCNTVSYAIPICEICTATLTLNSLNLVLLGGIRKKNSRETHMRCCWCLGEVVSNLCNLQSQTVI